MLRAEVRLIGKEGFILVLAERDGSACKHYRESDY